MNKQQLANRIWASANSMRNKIDANEYKDYILGLIFYKFLSDTEIKFLASLDIEEDDLPNVVEDENNPDMATLIEECQKRIGFFIEYKYLFNTWLETQEFDVKILSEALSSFDRLMSADYEPVYEGIFTTLREGLTKLGDSAAAQTKALKKLIDQYWGKHSLLSILHNERERKNTEYINKSYLPNVFEPINMILFLTAKHSMGSLKAQNANVNYKGVIDNPMEGLIASAHEQALDQTERILNGFFTQAYSDIKQVFYQKNPEGPNLHYRLFVQKMIGGQIRSINFLEESEGTKRILFMINDLLGACQGGTIALDEIDTGVHDLLLKTMLESIDDWIDGQLIITTHNTYLLETLRPQSIYVINVDYLGNKEVHCLDEYDIHGTNNVRSMYIKGLFGGVPVVDEIEYGEIVEELRESGVPQEETE